MIATGKRRTACGPHPAVLTSDAAQPSAAEGRAHGWGDLAIHRGGDLALAGRAVHADRSAMRPHRIAWLLVLSAFVVGAVIGAGAVMFSPIETIGGRLRRECQSIADETLGRLDRPVEQPTAMDEQRSAAAKGVRATAQNLRNAGGKDSDDSTEALAARAAWAAWREEVMRDRERDRARWLKQCIERRAGLKNARGDARSPLGTT